MCLDNPPALHPRTIQSISSLPPIICKRNPKNPLVYIDNYTYDQANRLTNYNDIGQYQYNGDGLRVNKSVNGADPSDAFGWDIAEGLPLLLFDSYYEYIYGPGGMVLEQVTSANEVSYLHGDRLGSIRLVTDAGGSIANSYEYDAYGARTETGPGSIASTFGYTGEYTDEESGLVYLRARYYDPATQQFLTVDPATPITEQPYVYSGSNPVNAKDPSGLLVIGLCGSLDARVVVGVQGSFCIQIGSNGLLEFQTSRSDPYTVSTNAGFGPSAGLVVAPDMKDPSEMNGEGGFASVNAWGGSLTYGRSRVDATTFKDYYGCSLAPIKQLVPIDLMVGGTKTDTMYVGEKEMRMDLKEKSGFNEIVSWTDINTWSWIPGFGSWSR